MSEKTDALALAHKLLDEPNADPDDDLRMLARQLVRKHEKILRLEKSLSGMCDPTADLIQANRDTILRMHETAVAKVKKLLEASLGSVHPEGRWTARDEVVLATVVITRLNEFHPMHGESWHGWPEGS